MSVAAVPTLVIPYAPKPAGLPPWLQPFSAVATNTGDGSGGSVALRWTFDDAASVREIWVAVTELQLRGPAAGVSTETGPEYLAYDSGIVTLDVGDLTSGSRGIRRVVSPDAPWMLGKKTVGAIGYFESLFYTNTDGGAYRGTLRGFVATQPFVLQRGAQP